MGRHVSHEKLARAAEQSGTDATARLTADAPTGPHAALGLQSSAGNRATTRAIAHGAGTVPLSTATTHLGAALVHGRPSGRRFARAPRPGAVAADLATPGVKEVVLKKRIETTLTRLAADGKLRTREPVREVMRRIFPRGGGFDQAAYAPLVDLDDPSSIYRDVAQEGPARLDGDDRSQMLDIMREAGRVVARVMTDTAGIAEVFGSRADEAKANYGKISGVIANLIAQSMSGSRSMTPTSARTPWRSGKRGASFSNAACSERTTGARPSSW